MMDSIRIETGEKRIVINDDPNRVIVLNPSDMLFAEKFYQLIREFEEKSLEYETKRKAIEATTERDTYGLPVNAKEYIDLLHETCQYFRDKIDWLFGAGTSQMVFGDALNIDAITQLFQGLTPYFTSAREAKITPYFAPKPANGRRRSKK
jgi:hypothetical protein